MKGRSIIFLVVLLALAAGGLMMYERSQAERDQKALDEKISAWRYAYKDLAGMNHASDAIALVEIKDNKISKEISKGVFVSLYDTKVLEPIDGLSKDEVISLQLYGKDENEIISNSREPKLDVKAKYVLFMHKDKDGTYQIINPQGVYKLDEDKLVALTDDLLEGNNTVEELKEAIKTLNSKEKK